MFVPPASCSPFALYRPGVTKVTDDNAAGREAVSMANQELDLRSIPHGQRHPLVFGTFDRLQLNDSFVLVNDHDPAPLRMQMDFMRAGQLSWEYVERGPEAFRVKITRVKDAPAKKESSAANPA